MMPLECVFMKITELIQKQTEIISLQREAIYDLSLKVQTAEVKQSVEQISCDLKGSIKELHRLQASNDRKKMKSMLNALNSGASMDEDASNWWRNRY